MVTQDSFREDVKAHEMKVLLDQGVHRHLRFQNPKTSNQYFEIVTFPGTLVYVGDMGSFVFRRIADMFEFFRTQSKTNLEINPDYWGEKLEAVETRMVNPGYKVYSEDRLRILVEEVVAEWRSEYGLSEDEMDELNDTIESEISYCDGEYEARRSISEFCHVVGDRKFVFHDTWEWDCREYTGRFLWCCYALVWGIQQYDKLAVAHDFGVTAFDPATGCRPNSEMNEDGSVKGGPDAESR